jgi:hypothetical protein
LTAIDPVVELFSVQHGYTLQKWPIGGHYPNRKMHLQCGLVWRSIQITMEDRSDGQRYDEFFSEIPYNIFAAAWVDDSRTGLRWFAPHVEARQVPFCELLTALPRYLAHAHDYVSSFEETSIRSFGRSFQTHEPEA